MENFSKKKDLLVENCSLAENATWCQAKNARILNFNMLSTILLIVLIAYYVCKLVYQISEKFSQGKHFRFSYWEMGDEVGKCNQSSELVDEFF